MLDGNEASTCIIGDFNLGNIDWNLTRNNSNIAPLTYLNQLLVDFSYSNNLNQANGVTNGSGKILDLVFSDAPSCVVEEAPYGLCSIDNHHPPLEINITK